MIYFALSYFNSGLYEKAKNEFEDLIRQYSLVIDKYSFFFRKVFSHARYFS